VQNSNPNPKKINIFRFIYALVFAKAFTKVSPFLQDYRGKTESENFRPNPSVNENLGEEIG
jgi:hypothetical protein